MKLFLYLLHYENGYIKYDQVRSRQEFMDNIKKDLIYV